MRCATVVALALWVFSIPACSDGPSRLRNDTAASLVQEVVGEVGWDIRLGEVQFSSGGEVGPGQEYFRFYDLYRAVAEKGVVHITNERDLSERFSGWDDFFALTQQGVRLVATVELSPEGAQTLEIKQFANSERQYVWVSFGTGRVTGIVSNEALDVAGERYRLVMGTHQLELVPGLRKAWIQVGMPDYRDGKFRALFKFDPFQSRWMLRGVDAGPQAGAFTSEIVPDLLKSLR